MTGQSMIEKTISHYRIIQKIGGGGMELDNLRTDPRHVALIKKMNFLQ
jgi:hypothetical protein